ncbi:esterase family protein [Kibdelosporangium aridum]|uniref:Esterase family protein n=1 Tax=Kibdelosporangium aridum TaxID=2030 RepID=A0A428ZDV9_KIBAR|nr:alpha/beta hydrolase family protein [Kibdelosporangium aridum]RSM86249.1 esterase family protein [Kibdelosporangium aridum]
MFRRIRHPVRVVAAIALVLPAVLVTSAAAAEVGAPVRHSGGHARVISEEHVGQRLVDLTISSAALGQNATVRLLTPDGWGRRGPDQRWPVLYLLHGVAGSHADWTNDSDVEDIPELRDVLVVMPDADAGFYHNWWNYGAGGPPAWETFHLDELRQILEQGYGAGTRRAVAGLSMGGLGALFYAARRPGMFRAAASYSGLVHLLHPDWVESFYATVDEAQQAGFDLFRLWGDPVRQRQVWQAHDPYYLAGRLRHTPVFLSCGDGSPGPFDPPSAPADEEVLLMEMNRLTADRLNRAGAPLTTDFYGPGTHTPAYWERALHRSLPMLLRALRPGHLSPR